MFIKSILMNFEKGYLYHVYNQGNNKEKIFYNRDNYFFFLKKIDHHIKPYVDILAWCLMPNHFHLMMLVKEIELVNTHRVTQSHPVSKTILLQFNISQSQRISNYRNGTKTHSCSSNHW